MKPLVKPLLNSSRPRVSPKRSNDCYFLAIALRELLPLWDSEARTFLVWLSNGARVFDRALTVPSGELPKTIRVRRAWLFRNLLRAQNRLYCARHKDLSSIRGPAVTR